MLLLRLPGISPDPVELEFLYSPLSSFPSFSSHTVPKAHIGLGIDSLFLTSQLLIFLCRGSTKPLKKLLEEKFPVLAESELREEFTTSFFLRLNERKA